MRNLAGWKGDLAVAFVGACAGVLLGACASFAMNQPPSRPYSVRGAQGPIAVRRAKLNPDSTYARLAKGDSVYAVLGTWRPILREIVIDVSVNSRLYPIVLAHERCHASLWDAQVFGIRPDFEEMFCTAIAAGFQS